MINKKLNFSLMFVIMLIGFFAVSSQLAVPTAANTKQNSTHSHLNDDTNSTDSGSHDGGDNATRDDANNNGVNDTVEQAFQRDLQVQNDDHGFSASSKSHTNTSQDEYQIEFSTESGLGAQMEFQYHGEAQTANGSTSTELSYKIKFDKIIEFIDTGAVGYTNETILSTYQIGQSGWNPVVTTTNATSGLVTVNATTADGVFTLLLKLTGSFTTDNNVTLSPTSMKIDVLFNNFPYTTTGSSLAMSTFVKSGDHLQHDQQSEDEKLGYGHNETQLGIDNSGTNTTGFFAWADYAVADGANVPIVASSLTNATLEEGEAASMMYFSFNTTAQMQHMVWDPKMGVVSKAAQETLTQIEQSKSQTSTTPAGTTTTPVDSTPATADVTPQKTSSASSMPFSMIWGLFFLLAVPVTRKYRQR